MLERISLALLKQKSDRDTPVICIGNTTMCVSPTIYVFYINSRLSPHDNSSVPLTLDAHRRIVYWLIQQYEIWVSLIGAVHKYSQTKPIQKKNYLVYFVCIGCHMKFSSFTDNSFYVVCFEIVCRFLKPICVLTAIWVTYNRCVRISLTKTSEHCGSSWKDSSAANIDFIKRNTYNFGTVSLTRFTCGFNRKHCIPV